MTSTTGPFLAETWRRAGVRDVYRDFNELTLLIVATTLFGADMQGPKARTIVDAIGAAFTFFAQRATTGFIIPEGLPTPGNLQYAAAVATLDDVVYDLIANRRRAREETGEAAALELEEVGAEDQIGRAHV